MPTATKIKRYDWVPSDTDKEGAFHVEIQVTFADLTIETFPNDGFHELEVVKDLGPSPATFTESASDIPGVSLPQTLTTTYAVVGDWIDLETFEDVRFLLEFTPSDATSIEVRMEVDGKGGTTGYAKYDPDGTSQDTSITPADLATTSNRFEMRRNAKAVGRGRLLAKKTGGAGTATVDVAKFILHK